MRLFCDSSTASPFCDCRTHLPPSTPEIEKAWQSIPGEASTNSLEAVDSTDDPSDDLLPVFSKCEIHEFTHTPTSQYDEDDLYFLSPVSHASLSLSESTDSVGLTDSDGAGGASYTTGIAVSESSPTSKSSALARGSEDDLVHAAHSVYDFVTKDADSASNDAETTTTTTRAVEHALQAMSGVSVTRLRATLRTLTLQSFQEVWRERSTLWYAIEQSSHPFSRSGHASGSEYGHSARRLASFAGALFAAGVLRVLDLQMCIDSVRGVPSCLALHALRALIQSAGDRVCRAKTAVYMEALYTELGDRATLPEFVWDAEAQMLIWEIRDSISCYFNVQSEKREKAAAKTLPKSRPRKIAIASWSYPSF